jgi:hypothetical protein
MVKACFAPQVWVWHFRFGFALWLVLIAIASRFVSGWQAFPSVSLCVKYLHLSKRPPSFQEAQTLSIPRGSQQPRAELHNASP